MTDEPATPPDHKKPTIARVYNAGQGGKNNYPADRETAHKIIAISPGANQIPALNRAFVNRALRHAANSGIRQFIDIGAGIPAELEDTTHRNLLTLLGSGHASPDPDTSIRVVYIDKDPSAVSFLRGSQEQEPHIIAIYGDLARPGEITAHPRFAKNIDLTQPAAVILANVLHFVPAPAAYQAVDYIKKALAPGSHLIVSHATADHADPEIARKVQDAYEDAGIGPLTLRTRHQIQPFFNGWTLTLPGIVPVTDWHPDPGEQRPADTPPLYAATAVKPHPTG